MNTKSVTHCYVAADPAQPGSAWAAVVDDPKFASDNAKHVAEWMRKGATVERVTVEVAREMLSRWVRPESRPRALPNHQLTLSGSAEVAP